MLSDCIEIMVPISIVKVSKDYLCITWNFDRKKQGIKLIIIRLKICRMFKNISGKAGISFKLETFNIQTFLHLIKYGIVFVNLYIDT